MQRSRLAILLVVAALSAGCRHDPLRRAVEEGLAAQLRVPLPAVPATGLPPPRPGLRILITSSAIDVDDVDVVASWREPLRARLLHELPEVEAASLPFVHRGLVRIAGGAIAQPDTPAPGQLEIKALADVLAYARELDRRYLTLADEPSGPAPEPPGLDVYAAADTPYRILVSVLYTAIQSEYTPTLVARGPGGDVALPDSPGGLSAGPLPRIVFGPDGLTITLDSPYRGRVEDAVLPPRPRPGAGGHVGRPILAPDRACPSVPLREGAPDLARLGAILGRIHDRIPDLDTSVVVAAPDTPWRQVAAVAATATHAGLPWFQLGLVRPHAPAASCSEGILADDLRPEDVPRRRPW